MKYPSFFKQFLTNTCFVLFEVKSAFFCKAEISFLLAKFACDNLAAKLCLVNLLNYGVVTYFLWSSIFFSTVVRAVIVAKFVMLGILFSTSYDLALRKTLIIKLIILDVLFLTLIILALRKVLVTKLVISGILSSIFSIFYFHVSSFQILPFSTTLLSFLKSTGKDNNSSISTLLFKQFKLDDTFFNLPICKLSTSDFNLSK